jgi:hypothetical protein
MKRFVSTLLMALAMTTGFAQTVKTPAQPTQIEVRERTVSDLLFFPFSCIEAPMTTKDQAWQAVKDTFGNCESVNLCPGLHAGATFDFTYRGTPISICYYDWYDKRTWYDFFFETKKEADEFYSNLVNDIRDAGIPLVKDNIYGGMSTRKKPVSIFKWVSVDVPVKVKEVSPSNIETGDHVGKYKVELGVMKK